MTRRDSFIPPSPRHISQAGSHTAFTPPCPPLTAAGPSAMSVATHSEQYACEVAGCPATFARAEAVHGSFCSAECYYREKGERILNTVDDDPHTCSTCYEPLINPGLGARYELLYDDPAAVDAIDMTDDDKYPPHVWRPTTGCACGAVDTGAVTEELRIDTPEARANSLWRALNRLYARGTIEAEPDADPFREAFQAGVRNHAELAGRACFS